MGTWMPQIDPALLKAALGARQPIPAAPQMPRQPLRPANAMPLPAPLPPPTDLPQAATAQPPAPASSMGSPDPTAQLRSRYNAMPTPTGPPPLPSDNPAIAAQPENPWAKAVADARAGVDEERQRADTLMAQQPKAPNYEDYKPKLWQKIVAPFANMVPGVGGYLASNMLYGPWNRALGDYGRQNKAWNEKMQAEEKVGVPLAADRARIAQEGFTNWMATQKQTEVERHNREVESFKSDLNDIRRMYDEGRLDAAQRRLDETAEKNKNNAEIQGQILEVRRQLADASSLRAEKYKSGGGGGKTSASGFRVIETKKQTDLAKAEHDYATAIDDAGGDYNSPAAKRALDVLTKRKDQIQAAYEAEIESAGGSVGGAAATPKVGATVTEQTKTFTVPKGAPPPQKPHQQLKSGGKVIAYSADGKTWGPPQ